MDGCVPRWRPGLCICSVGRGGVGGVQSNSPTLRHALAAHHTSGGSPLRDLGAAPPYGHFNAGPQLTLGAPSGLPGRGSPQRARPAPPHLVPHPPPGSPPRTQKAQHTARPPQSPHSHSTESRAGAAARSPAAKGTLAQQQEALLAATDEQRRRARALASTVWPSCCVCDSALAPRVSVSPSTFNAGRPLP